MTEAEPTAESTEEATEAEPTAEPEELTEEPTAEPTEEPEAGTATHTMLRDGKYVKVGLLTDRNYCVVVRYAPESGIPADARLTVTEITDPLRFQSYFNDAKSALEENGEEMRDFYLLSVSLISGGVDYANSSAYEVEIVLSEDLEAEPEEIRAFQFGDDGATLLDTVAEVNDEDRVDHIAFRAQGKGGDVN